jgi:hypothetical protein
VRRDSRSLDKEAGDEEDEGQGEGGGDSEGGASSGFDRKARRPAHNVGFALSRRRLLAAARGLAPLPARLPDRIAVAAVMFSAGDGPSARLTRPISVASLRPRAAF